MSEAQFYVYVVLSLGCDCNIGGDDFEGVFATREAAQGYIDSSQIDSSLYTIYPKIIDQPLRVSGLKDG